MHKYTLFDEASNPWVNSLQYALFIDNQAAMLKDLTLIVPSV